MHTDLMITPEDAKTFARKLFTSCYSDHELWFDVAWEVLEEAGTENISTSVNKQIVGLAAADDSSLELLTMADDFAMFFEMFMLKSPELGTSLAERIQRIVRQRSGGNFDRTKLLQRIISVLDLELSPSADSNEKQKNQSLHELIKEQFAETNEIIKTGHQGIQGRADGLNRKLKEVEETVIKNSNENKKEVVGRIATLGISNDFFIILKQDTLSELNKPWGNNRFAGNAELIIQSKLRECLDSLKIGFPSVLFLVALKVKTLKNNQKTVSWDKFLEVVPMWAQGEYKYNLTQITRRTQKKLHEYSEHIFTREREHCKLIIKPENIIFSEELGLLLKDYIDKEYHEFLFPSDFQH